MKKMQEVTSDIALSLARFGHNTGNNTINGFFLRFAEHVGVYPKIVENSAKGLADQNKTEIEIVGYRCINPECKKNFLINELTQGGDIPEHRIDLDGQICSGSYEEGIEIKSRD
jgi:hypothetical protein